MVVCLKVGGWGEFRAVYLGVGQQMDAMVWPLVEMRVGKLDEKHACWLLCQALKHHVNGVMPVIRAVAHCGFP